MIYSFLKSYDTIGDDSDKEQLRNQEIKQNFKKI